ncbi:MAG: hypothetical protein J1F18_10995 [Lachnospiraceae bacterium]|nr:hypothetical protein [Lachnospiraceae bacterium]
MNTDMDKIRKSSNVALIIARICKIFCIGMAILAFITGVLLVGLNDRINEELSKALQAGESLPELDDMGMLLGVGNRLISRSDDFGITLGVYVITVGVFLAILSVLMHYISKVFKEIKEGYSPFQLSIVKNMKVAFVIITVLSLNSSLLIGALIGFSLWCAFCIFEYGCELQKQSDETL